MTGDKRGSTHLGRPAVVPATAYDAPPEVTEVGHGELVVRFVGEDGRSRLFDVARLPLPGWHRPLAEAFARRVGPAGGLRTLSSAEHAWAIWSRFLRYLAGLPDPPAAPGDLSAPLLDSYLRARESTVGRVTVWRNEFVQLRELMRCPALRECVPARAVDYLERRVAKYRMLSTPGYSDGELARLIAAARADVAALRGRIDSGQRLVARWNNDSTVGEGATVAEAGGGAVSAGELAGVAATGVVPDLAGLDGVSDKRGERRLALARHLFVTPDDLESVLALLVAVTGRNSETVKELPVVHRVLDGVAVELRVIKRRRGPRRWYETVTWEIGPPHRELHTPGGLYLLLHRLMAASRRFSGSATIWSVWSNPSRRGAGGHRDPFAARLSGCLNWRQWTEQHDLRADPTGEEHSGGPLEVRLARIRTSIEVRRTRQMGGHLPSAARSNSVGVLFSNYLRGDPTAREWAEEILGQAVTDAEQAALAAHRHVLRDTGASNLRVRTTTTREGSADAAATQEGAWAACTDPASHPRTGRACDRVSFLDCFHCGNCLITPAHLPAILRLLHELERRRTQLSEPDWWQRYGASWAAIRHDVLPKFTPAELQRAADQPAHEALLELAEAPWERP